MITFDDSLSLDELKILVNPYIGLHYKEVFGDYPPFNFNWGFYEHNFNSFIFIIAIYNDNKFAGYCSYIVLDTHFAKGFIRTHIDSIYILPEYRGTEVFKETISWICNETKEKFGSKMMSANLPIKKNLSKMKSFNGFIPKEIIYYKRIK